MDPDIAELESTQEYKILNPLVHQSDASVTDAMQKLLNLTSATMTGNKPNNLGNHPYNVFTSLIDIVARTVPEKQSLLVDFISQLQKETVVNATTGEALTHYDRAVWNELPSFGWTIRDEWNTDPAELDTKPAERQSWENKNAFLAQLTAAADVDYESDKISPMDFSLYALWSFRDAFETEASVQKPGDAAVRAACWWYIYAADRLWANVKHSRVFPKRSGISRGKYEEKAWRGYNRERWAAWQNGLVNAQANDMDEESKILIRDALEHIKRVESET